MRPAKLQLALWLVLCGACQELKVELAPDGDGHSQVCSSVTCAEIPRCQDGSRDCLACTCCSCVEGQPHCDATFPSRRWICRSGCFVPDDCAIDERCEPSSGRCVPGQIDCQRATQEGFDGILRCNQWEELCEACGPCYGGVDAEPWLCAQAGTISQVLMLRPEGCYSVQDCFSDQVCRQGDCIRRDYLPCDEGGCTTKPMCELPDYGCGECGCCALPEDTPDRCFQQSDANVKWSFDAALGCFHESRCQSGLSCFVDTTGIANCVED